VTASETSIWKRCSTCKKPLLFGAGYFACNVSTCNRRGTDFAFCSVACWDGHVPVLRHRESWAVEERAPTAEEWARSQRERVERVARPREPVEAPQRAAAAGGARGAAPHDVLVVVSKLKLYVRETSGMHCSDGVVEVLSDRLRTLCDQAIEHARAAGRRTVLDRDFHGVR
jgi:hypothetical protein